MPPPLCLRRRKVRRPRVAAIAAAARVFVPLLRGHGRHSSRPPDKSKSDRDKSGSGHRSNLLLQQELKEKCDLLSKLEEELDHRDDATTALEVLERTATPLSLNHRPQGSQEVNESEPSAAVTVDGGSSSGLECFDLVEGALNYLSAVAADELKRHKKRKMDIDISGLDGEDENSLAKQEWLRAEAFNAAPDEKMITTE
ncbi:hypothetical protein HPB52_001950 [Rhipicephalus sanguineus]|uniref:Uncharacterized protein n=1 Tax=Rhipicephalus sanguineus TaxID=34632 RepID=A0A9D4PR36_RHISA|nr:hypothetical protein HPB52_001950 [Rhipicephalus sanguineus]